MKMKKNWWKKAERKKNKKNTPLTFFGGQDNQPRPLTVGNDRRR